MAHYRRVKKEIRKKNKVINSFVIRKNRLTKYCQKDCIEANVLNLKVCEQCYIPLQIFFNEKIADLLKFCNHIEWKSVTNNSIHKNIVGTHTKISQNYFLPLDKEILF